MSDHRSIAASASAEGGSPTARRGQTMVEFALVLPMLLVLFLGVADFGRVFHAGIVVEAAARNAAEVVAEEYRRNPPAALSLPAPDPADPSYYSPLHDLGGSIACEELRTLPSTTYDPTTRQCRVVDGDPVTYDWMPVILVCIHDEADPLCEDPAFGATIPDPECSALLTPIGPEMRGVAVGENSRYVEVRICYQFTTLVSLPILSIGEIWLQKSRTFTVADYPLPTPSIPPPASAPPAEELPSVEPSLSESSEASPSESASASASAAATPVPDPEPTPPPTPSPTPSLEPTPNPNETPTPEPTP